MSQYVFLSQGGVLYLGGADQSKYVLDKLHILKCNSNVQRRLRSLIVSRIENHVIATFRMDKERGRLDPVTLMVIVV
jgi:hypothetical protein